MKRDMDLVRSLLIYMTENDFVRGRIDWGEVIPGRSSEEVRHHFHLMGEAGLINAVKTTTMSDLLPMAIPSSITWAGHDFLDAIKDESLWEKAKSTVIKPAGGVAFSVLLDWAKAEAARRLGIG